MPAAQLKMLRYMRNPEPKGNGPGAGSPRAANAQPPPPQSAPPPPPPPQHAPPPLAARQPLVDAAKIPVPVSSSRYASSSQAPSTNTSIPTIPQPTRHQSAQQLHQRLEQQQQQQQQQQQGHHLPPQRMRANSADNGRVHALTDREQQIWEESTINSMFSDGASGPARQRPNHSRYDSPYPPPSRQIQYDRSLRNRGSEELSPFVIGDNGLLKVLPTSAARAQKAEASATEEAHYDSPAKNSNAGSNNNPTLKHAKYPFRDGRAATKRASFTGRLSHHADPDDALVSSPERLRTVLSGIEPRDRDADTKRSTFFHDVDTPLHRTPAPPEDNESSAPSQGDEATNQRTPRLSRPSTGKLLAAAKGLLESSLPRNSIPISQQQPQPQQQQQQQQQQRDRKTATSPASKKRRLSLDYDDHALHSMSYSDLKKEVFDYDPARVAIQAAAVPTGECLEDKLAYYKTKDENAQHHFFTQVSVQEWETCGDWFLQQFSLVVNEMRSRRHAKRKLVADFEAEIADREKTVRSKVESIDRTLNELKKDGEVMMKGRDVDL